MRPGSAPPLPSCQCYTSWGEPLCPSSGRTLSRGEGWGSLALHHCCQAALSTENGKLIGNSPPPWLREGAAVAPSQDQQAQQAAGEAWAMR